MHICPNHCENKSKKCYITCSPANMFIHTDIILRLGEQRGTILAYSEFGHKTTFRTFMSGELRPPGGAFFPSAYKQPSLSRLQRLISSKARHKYPGKLTWNLKVDLWKTIFLYKPVVFRFHVNLPDCQSVYDVTAPHHYPSSWPIIA